MKKIIHEVEIDSIAHEMGIESGDYLISINGEKIVDVFDYRMAIDDEKLELVIEKSSGEEWILDIEKDEDEELGLVLAGGASGMMDKPRSCANKCVFCFIHQNPKGLRQSLYFQDDDYRLSFLHGNYITLTNLVQRDIDRILKHHISPVNISIHSTDPEIRRTMMGNKNAGDSLKYLSQLANGGIALSLQIVLCKNYNDNKHLDKTIYDLSRYVPKGAKASGYSLCVVPAGLTRYREENGLAKIVTLNKEDCINVINQVEYWQNKFLGELGIRFVYAADELYLKAEKKFPSIEAYEDFSQIENGVGMISLLKHEFYGIIKNTVPKNIKKRKITLATGVAAYELIQGLCKELERVYLGLETEVIAIKNDFFGHGVIVSGLMVGNDIISQLKQKELGEDLLLPDCCLRRGEEVLLDDMSLTDISKELNVKITSVPNSAQDFIKAVLGEKVGASRHNDYEGSAVVKEYSNILGNIIREVK